MRIFPKDIDTRDLRTLCVDGDFHCESNAMSACDTCSNPGHCCKDFVLHNGKTGVAFPEGDWENRANAYIARHSLPFKALRIDNSQFHETLEGHVGVRYMCPLLTPEGRCGDYENRPALCREYEPLSDRLCVMYVEPITSDQL